jgi:CubicO group peptidase (beta-lactamase class C family)
MGTTGSERIREYLAAHIAAGDFPGASYLVAEGRRVLAEGALGHSVLSPEVIPAGIGTLYDLASLTKPLACALLAVLLESEGRLRLGDAVTSHLPEWAGAGDREGLTLADLLTHRSGLPAWKPLYLHASDRASRIEYLKVVPLEYKPGSRVVYSCPGYILAGLALERVAGQSLDRLFDDRVARPLGLADLLYRPAPGLRRRIAATETGNARERVLAGPEGQGYNGWREDVIWGEAHDNNAATLGGASGNAGLFGTARAVHEVAAEIMGQGAGLIPEAGRAVLLANATGGLVEDRSVGFQMATTPGCSAGSALSPASVGHTGFTGTSLWIDVEARRIYVLLTNRVHPRYHDLDMNAIRRGFHLIAASI